MPSRNAGSRTLELHIACNRLIPIPLMGPKIRICKPDTIRAKTYSFEQDFQPSEKDLEFFERLEKVKSYTGLLDLPLRWSGYVGLWATRFGNYLWTLFSIDSFVIVKIAGQRGIMNIPKKAAWILDDGRALDRLVKHRV